MPKSSQMKAYYASNASSLTNSIGRKKSITAGARQHAFNQHPGVGGSGPNVGSMTAATTHTNPSQQTQHTSGSLSNLQRNHNIGSGSHKLDHRPGRQQKLSTVPSVGGVTGAASFLPAYQQQYSLDRSKSLLQSHHSGQTAGSVTMSTLNSQGHAGGPSHQRQRSRKLSSGVRKVGQHQTTASHEMYHHQQRSSHSQSVNRIGGRHHQS
jgi:hypothetical protein